MIKTNIEIMLYKLDELNEEARQRAIDEHRNFLLEIMRPEDFDCGDPCIDTPERSAAIYEAEYNHILNNDNPVIESIKINEYLFYSNGKMAHIVTYTGKHEKSGQTYYIFEGKEYRIA